MSSSPPSAPKDPAPLEKRAVAGSFLFKYAKPNDQTNAQVLLFRRSDEVRTYQNKLAPCSGSVEPGDANPHATALREIKEETGLPASALELLYRGKPYSFVDESIGREWTINPFAFRLKDVFEPGGVGESGIKLDWEHKGYEWFDPTSVNASDEFGGVPRIVDSLRRVWPAYDLGPKAAERLDRGLRELRDDHENGAAMLARSAVLTLRDVIELMETREDPRGWEYTRESLKAKISMVAWHSLQARPAMAAAITTAMIKALDQLGSILCPGLFDRQWSVDEAIPRMVEVLDEGVARADSGPDRIRTSFLQCMRRSSRSSISILTLSHSSTVSACLVRAASELNVDIDLRILESRPLYEGVTLASHILKSEADGVEKPTKITIYSDAAAAAAANDVDFVVLGADRVSSAGDVSNKIGSLPAVLAAREASGYRGGFGYHTVKIIIVTDTDKIAGPGAMQEHETEENSPLELTRSWEGVAPGASELQIAISSPTSGQQVTVKNPYFEWVPAKLIDSYITDQGTWTAKKIREQSQWIGEKTERFFGDHL